MLGTRGILLLAPVSNIDWIMPNLMRQHRCVDYVTLYDSGPCLSQKIVVVRTIPLYKFSLILNFLCGIWTIKSNIANQPHRHDVI